MDNDMNPNSARIRVYHPRGFQVYIEFAYTDPASAYTEVEAIADAGWLPSPPDLPPGGEKEKIVTVVRRRKPSDGTPIIDFYPEWQHDGKFGMHKYAHMYLDDAETIAQFEAQSGLKLGEIPLYNGQTALRRNYGKVSEFETAVKTPFDLVKIPDGEHEGGMPKYRYQYALEKTVKVTDHWATDDKKRAIKSKMDTLGLTWDMVSHKAEPERVLEKLNDTTLTEAEFLKRLDEIALDGMQGGGNKRPTDNPLHNTRKTA